MRFLILFAAFASASAFADSTATVPATTYTLTRAGSKVANGLADTDACVAAAKADTEQQKTGAQYECGPTLTFTTAYTPPCPVQPATQTQTVACPAGTTGSWAQTRAYTAAPSPTCWVAGDWMPTTAPDGSCIPIPTPTDGYTQCAVENTTCAITASGSVIYGACSTFTAPRSFSTSTPCTNVVFGDPLYGVVKACWFKADPVGGFDAMGMPRVDKSKIPMADPAQQYTTDRIQPLPLNPDGTIFNPSVYEAVQNLSTIGAFRESCNFAGMNNDDALVFPGQPGVSHLHTYFGVLSDANTTSANIRSAPWSTCAGGTLNKTAYWMPALIDTKDGTPLKPASNNVYYKGSYFFDAATDAPRIVPVPVGLHLIVGSAANTDPAQGSARFICYGPSGENPGWKRTIAAAYADGTCVPGGDFNIEIGFPICWDGVNLDSPDHRSHVVDPVQLMRAPFTWSCPADHPARLPTISYNIHYTIPDSTAVSRWYLSSDHYPAPAGTSAHADYLMGWDEATVKNFTTHCINEQRDCHNFLLGDNLHMLY